MKKTRTIQTKKLALSRTTLRTLAADRLGPVRAAAAPKETTQTMTVGNDICCCSEGMGC
jgi:hypothetical protein